MFVAASSSPCNCCWCVLMRRRRTTTTTMMMTVLNLDQNPKRIPPRHRFVAASALSLGFREHAQGLPAISQQPVPETRAAHPGTSNMKVSKICQQLGIRNQQNLNFDQQGCGIRPKKKQDRKYRNRKPMTS